MPSQRVVSLASHHHEGAANESGPSPISFRAILRASRRYWWLILALWTVGTTGLGVAVYLRVRPVYRAVSFLKVDPSPIDLYGRSSSEGGEPYMKTHVELIKIPNVLSDAASKEKVMALARFRAPGIDPIQELTKIIQVRIVPDTYLIEVSMMSQSAVEAAIVVNAVVDSFLDMNRTWSSVSSNNQIAQLSTHLGKLDDDIKLTKDDLRIRAARMSKQAQITVIPKDPDANEPAEKTKSPNYTVDRYHKMLDDSMTTRLDLLMAENVLADARRVVDELALEPDPSAASPRLDAQTKMRIDSDPEVRDLIRQQEDARRKLKTVQRTSRFGNDPAERPVVAKLQELSQRINDTRSRKFAQFQAEVSNPAFGAMHSANPMLELRRAETEVHRLATRKTMLDNELSNLKLESSKQQSEEVEIQFAEKELEAYLGNREIVSKKLAQIRFESGADERIQLRNAARVEKSAISDKRLQYMAIAPIGVFGLVLGLVVLLEIRSGRVADTEVLSARMRHEVFAIAPLPNTRLGIGSEGEKSEQRLARFVQSLDHLRVALCEGGTNGEARCVMITSAMGGEGKTTLSAHLAARCANAGTSTLLIDADLRRASLGRLLDVPAGMGLGDVLAGQAELDATLITVQAGGFHFLSAGTPGIDPTRVLKSSRLAELIGHLRQMYDLVIIDTPPVLPVADALILGRWADGAVMAARYDASRLPLVERATRQIIAAGIPVLGVVVNGVKGQDQAYGSYSYSYSYPGRSEPLDGSMKPS